MFSACPVSGAPPVQWDDSALQWKPELSSSSFRKSRIKQGLKTIWGKNLRKKGVKALHGNALGGKET